MLLAKDCNEVGAPVSTAFHAGADHSANNNPAAEMFSLTFPFSATAVWE